MSFSVIYYAGASSTSGLCVWYQRAAPGCEMKELGLVEGTAVKQQLNNTACGFMEVKVAVN